MKRAVALILFVCLLFVSGCSGNDKNSSNSSSSVKFDISKASYSDIYKQAVKLSHPLNNEIGLTNARLEYDKKGNLKSFLLNIWSLQKQDSGVDYWAEATFSFDSKDGLEYNAFTTVDLKTAYNEFGKVEMYLKKFTDNLQAMNVKSLMNKYRVGTPDFYGLYYDPEGAPINVDDVLNKNAKTKFLYFKSDKFTSVDPKKDLHVPPFVIPDKDYFMILPYYAEGDGVMGIGEYTIGTSVKTIKKYLASNLIFIVTDKQFSTSD